MKYPVWIRDGKSQMLDDRIFYEIAKNGIFLHKETSFWKAVVPVGEISGLEAASASVHLSIPQIPKDIVYDTARFFAWIYRNYHTEVAALLWISEDGRNYRVSIPDQVASARHVAYEIPDRCPGELLLGTFHSHGSMYAFHSPMDEEDEHSFDGIHGTFGDFSSYASDFSVSIEVVIHGTRFKLNPIDWLEGIVKHDPEKTNNLASLDKYASSFFRGNRDKYILTPGFDLLPKDYEPSKTWTDKVRTKYWLGSEKIKIKEGVG